MSLLLARTLGDWSWTFVLCPAAMNNREKKKTQRNLKAWVDGVRTLSRTKVVRVHTHITSSSRCQFDVCFFLFIRSIVLIHGLINWQTSLNIFYIIILFPCYMWHSPTTTTGFTMATAIVRQHGLIGDSTNEEKNFIITADRSFSTISCPALLFIMLVLFFSQFVCGDGTRTAFFLLWPASKVSHRNNSPRIVGLLYVSHRKTAGGSYYSPAYKKRKGIRVVVFITQ